MSSNPQFRFMADVTGAPEKGCFVGVASSCNPDRHNQILTSKALASMASQAPIPLVVGPTHEGTIVDVRSEVGKVVEFWTEDDGNTLKFNGKLDPAHPDYEFWCSKLDPENEFAFNYKTSIGGWIPKEAISKVWKAGGQFEKLDEFRLNHLLFCRGDAAVNQDTEIAAGMSDPQDWTGAIFMAMATGVAEQNAEVTPESVDEVQVGAAVAVTETGAAEPPDVYELNSQIRFALDRMLRQSPDDDIPYIIGVYVDGTVLYEMFCDGDYCQYMCKWAYENGSLTLTDPVEVKCNVEVTRTYTTKDGEPIAVFNASPMITDDVTGEEMVRGLACGNAARKKVAMKSGKADAVADMPKGFWEKMTGFISRFMADESTGEEEAQGMAGDAVETVVEETAEEVTVADAPAMPDGLGEMIAKAIADGIAKGMEAVVAAGKTEVAEAEAEVTETAEETEAAAAEDEVASEKAETEGDGGEVAADEVVAEEETGAEDAVVFGKADLDQLNQTLTAILGNQKAQDERLTAMEQRGMATGKSTQVSVSATTPPPAEKSGLGIGSFLLN